MRFAGPGRSYRLTAIHCQIREKARRFRRAFSNFSALHPVTQGSCGCYSRGVRYCLSFSSGFTSSIPASSFGRLYSVATLKSVYHKSRIKMQAVFFRIFLHQISTDKRLSMVLIDGSRFSILSGRATILRRCTLPM